MTGGQLKRRPWERTHQNTMNSAFLLTAMSLVLLLTACGKGEKSTRQQGKASSSGQVKVQPRLAPVPLKPIKAPPGAPRELALDLGDNVKLKLMLVPAGKFMMGRPKVAKGMVQNDLLHEVTISKAFYMGKHEVTQRQYQQVMGTNPSQSKGFDLPLEMASWDDAREFCQKVAAKTGQTVRLPTEAEWEYACRAGGASIYSTGNSEAHLDQLGWYDKNSGDMSLSFANGQKTHPVGQKTANGWGLHDMHGNVWEWCHDKFQSYGPKAVVDPQGPDAPPELCWSRVIRGGSFGSNMDWCRSASRYNETSVTRKKDIGFRVAVSLPKAP